MALLAPTTRCLSRPASSSRAAVAVPRLPIRARNVRVFSSTETDPELMGEAERKKLEAEKLRAAEKFMVIGSGSATCKGCGYEYKPEKGDPEFPVAPGTTYQSLPEDYTCPICGAPKTKFESRVKVVAGFAENQQYGLGGNSMTEAQKSGLIYGALALFFALFLAGYALE
ncbi:hypothetical protein CHLRE_07g315150v5 [Chlamydomonas reinhardtii]|uniref:Uncharacterized protein n=1 Tax=Chlamydomonas reinhardtii TaxID=3055 RepID=A8I686_CHLRE|nr:uncharacterized protein CHLRE_07g315150v5 [Chlamydomonas reinhardtii]PNW80381.1 hypothetical protein CHLRE_07g315150v5 [Chlamydomonas reinhardtii]|eukprot:XP_001700979.1 rubredoxin [Chlamydomonas reinhardtii]